MSQHVYDYAVIGSGLSGLAIAAALSKETHNVALLESGDHMGGANKLVRFPTGPINNGLRFVPDTESALKALHFLESIVGLKIISGSRESAPLTYENGQLKQFLGFGENPPDFYEEMAYFSATKQLSLHLEPYMWTQLLFDIFKGQFFPRSYVTRLHKEGEQVSHLTINGAKTLKAHNYIFCGHVKDLCLLVGDEVLSPRVKQKLSKNTYWTGLCLDLCHNHQVTESLAMHILNGTTQDELGPCVGHFLPVVEENGEKLQASQWMTFVEQEATEDSEVIGHALKKIKRQIKRAYPAALENLKIERIMVAPMLGGTGELKLNANQTLPHLGNLWIGSAAINPQKNLLGALLQAEYVLTAMGMVVSADAKPLATHELNP